MDVRSKGLLRILLEGGSPWRLGKYVPAKELEVAPQALQGTVSWRAHVGGPSELIEGLWFHSEGNGSTGNWKTRVRWSDCVSVK